jgi:hypothetical protein
VEIILNMREKMEEMQRQIEQFVASLNSEIAQRVRQPAPGPDSQALVPVISVASLVRVESESAPVEPAPAEFRVRRKKVIL